MRRLAQLVRNAEDVGVAVAVGRDDRVVRGGRATIRGGVVSSRIVLGMTIVRCERSSLTTGLVGAVRQRQPAGVNDVPDELDELAAAARVRCDEQSVDLLAVESSIQTSMLSLLRSLEADVRDLFAGSLLSGEKTCACCVP